MHSLLHNPPRLCSYFPFPKEFLQKLGKMEEKKRINRCDTGANTQSNRRGGKKPVSVNWHPSDGTAVLAPLACWGLATLLRHVALIEQVTNSRLVCDKWWQMPPVWSLFCRWSNNQVANQEAEERRRRAFASEFIFFMRNPMPPSDKKWLIVCLPSCPWAATFFCCPGWNRVPKVRGFNKVRRKTKKAGLGHTTCDIYDAMQRHCEEIVALHFLCARVVLGCTPHSWTPSKIIAHL